MRGDEKRVADAFVAWLQENGVNFVDVCARRGDERLYAEAKGRTAAIGLDVDTLYGQLLRRMADPGTGARYAVVSLLLPFRQPCASRPGSVNGWTSKCARLTMPAEFTHGSERG